MTANDRGLGKISIYEDELYGDAEVKEATRQFVVFQLCDESYAVDIEHVREVVDRTVITHLPSVPEHIQGIFNLRGNIVSVTDLKKVFSITGDESSEQLQRIVVIENEDMSTGLLVEGSERVVEIPVSEIEQSVATLEEEHEALIVGQVEWEGSLIAILDAKRLLQRTKAGS